MAPASKRARKEAAEEGEAEPKAEEEAEEEEEAAAPRKRAVVATPEVLEPGACVLYWDDWRGIIHDAFEAIDSFWVADEESGEVVRDESGEIVPFKSFELKLIAPPPKVKDSNPYAPAVGVFIIGTSPHMMRVLEHFGPPDPAKRTEPQELLAMPCSFCDPASLLKTARDGVNPVTLKLAQDQRPDLHVAFRAYHLRYAVEQCTAALLRLEDYFCLVGVNVPYSEDEIKEGKDKEEKRWRRSIANQLDACVTAYGQQEGETPLVEAAQQALGRSCGICLSEVIWNEAAQARIRKNLGVPELPLRFEDSMKAQIYVVVLPEDASVTEEGGIISFHEAFGSDYANIGLEAEGDGEEEPETVKAADDEPSKTGPEGAKDKTVSQWEAEQDKFADQPKPPPGWIRVTSRSTGKTYFYNKETKESSFEFPLPEGWVKQVSKSTGKTYYFNAQKKLSTFVRPTE